MDLTERPRRLRGDGIRGLVSETDLAASDLIAPVFVDATAERRRPIPSMPGHERVPVEDSVARVEEVLATGVEAVILFGIPEEKDPEGSRAWAEDGVIQRATRRIVAETDATVLADLCFCEYTDHGHCGVLEPGAREEADGGRGADGSRGADNSREATRGGSDAGTARGGTDGGNGEAVDGRRDEAADGEGAEVVDGGGTGTAVPGHRGGHLTVDNDATLENVRKTAVSQAEAGADVIAPSGMMDGQVAAIREALDGAGFESVPILAYAAKYESAFYGPFRDAADGAPAFGDRRHYQMDPANGREALREVRLDAAQGADVLMIKPALPYLDVVARVRDEVDRPVAAYNVSGEYAMLHAAAEKGWLDLEAVARESLLSIKRAGADLIVTYFAEDLAERL